MVFRNVQTRFSHMLTKTVFLHTYEFVSRIYHWANDSHMPGSPQSNIRILVAQPSILSTVVPHFVRVWLLDF